MINQSYAFDFKFLYLRDTILIINTQITKIQFSIFEYKTNIIKK